MFGTIQDITERKKAEEQIKASLNEKEVLLKEIHHRVKNNMQVISSLLNLQTKHIKDQQLIDIFKDCQNRIKSMALIHEELYRKKDLARVDFSEYTRTLSSRILKSYEIYTDRVLLKTIMNNVSLGVDKAIPCGLIINELLSNSLKYAFPFLKEGDGHGEGGLKGEICINFSPVNNKYELVYSDNGVGLPEDLDFRNTKSLGLQLVNSLTQQIGGVIELDRSKGTEFKITFDT
jgi:two-component sensor histidine kinase